MPALQENADISQTVAMDRSPSIVQSVDRALRILEQLAEDAEGLRLSDVAERTRLAPSTVHRLLTSLEHRQFVHFAKDRAVWHIGGRAFRVGAAFVRRRTFVTPAAPMMRELRDATRETVNVGAPEDGSVVILAQVESREVVRAINIIGGRAPLSSSGLGKAILATYDDDAFAAHIERHGLPRCTTNTITDPKILRNELAVVRDRGFALDCEEHFMGLHCVAAPVFDATGEAVAAISVSGLAVRMTDDRINAIGSLVMTSARQLTASLDGSPPNDWNSI